jgi:hypothetical protein
MLNEPGYTMEKHKHIVDYYTAIISYKNVITAICGVINKNNGSIPYEVHSFYPFAKKHFIENYDRIYSNTLKHLNEYPSGARYSFDKIYRSMDGTIDFQLALDNLKKIESMLKQ